MHTPKSMALPAYRRQVINRMLRAAASVDELPPTFNASPLNPYPPPPLKAATAPGPAEGRLHSVHPAVAHYFAPVVF